MLPSKQEIIESWKSWSLNEDECTNHNCEKCTILCGDSRCDSDDNFKILCVVCNQEICEKK